jgi:SH3 domain-containing YSC84-like protein 1
MRTLVLTLSALLVLAPNARGKERDSKEARRLAECEQVLTEVLGMPESIPRDLLDKAECVIVIPSVKKAAFGFGARWGKGAALCRRRAPHDGWSAPLMMSLGGGSFGLQIGGQATDFVLLVMNEKGMGSLLKSKFTLGADASVAAGPKGRTTSAATDAQMRAEILTYSRSRGVFAGVAIEGAVLKRDEDANKKVYGEPVGAQALLFEGRYAVPASGKRLVEALGNYSPARR